MKSKTSSNWKLLESSLVVKSESDKSGWPLDGWRCKWCRSKLLLQNPSQPATRFCTATDFALLVQILQLCVNQHPRYVPSHCQPSLSCYIKTSIPYFPSGHLKPAVQGSKSVWWCIFNSEVLFIGRWERLPRLLGLGAMSNFWDFALEIKLWYSLYSAWKSVWYCWAVCSVLCSVQVYSK